MAIQSSHILFIFLKSITCSALGGLINIFIFAGRSRAKLPSVKETPKDDFLLRPLHWTTAWFRVARPNFKGGRGRKVEKSLLQSSTKRLCGWKWRRRRRRRRHRVARGQQKLLPSFSPFSPIPGRNPFFFLNAAFKWQKEIGDKSFWLKPYGCGKRRLGKHSFNARRS